MKVPALFCAKIGGFATKKLEIMGAFVYNVKLRKFGEGGVSSEKENHHCGF